MQILNVLQYYCNKRLHTEHEAMKEFGDLNSCFVGQFVDRNILFLLPHRESFVCVCMRVCAYVTSFRCLCVYVRQRAEKLITCNLRADRAIGLKCGML